HRGEVVGQRQQPPRAGRAVRRAPKDNADAGVAAAGSLEDPAAQQAMQRQGFPPNRERKKNGRRKETNRRRARPAWGRAGVAPSFPGSRATHAALAGAVACPARASGRTGRPLAWPRAPRPSLSAGHAQGLQEGRAVKAEGEPSASDIPSSRIGQRSPALLFRLDAPEASGSGLEAGVTAEPRLDAGLFVGTDEAVVGAELRP